MAEMPKARQSQLVTTYGVGSLFPAGDQSLMICGLDDWDERSSPVVEEPRLARSLGVTEFRSPSSGRRSGDVPAVRFPEWHYCPQCRKLAPFWKFDQSRMRCDRCDRELTPSRFVACCEDGHIEDFPYFQWLHRGNDSESDVHNMRLETRGASSSLADVVIRCSCGARPYDLAGSFARFALRGIKACSGSRPWLPGASREACEKPLRVLQRGSANVWFATTRSAISIPPWSNPDAQFVSKRWDTLQHLPHSMLEETVPKIIESANAPGVSAAGVVSVIRQRSGLDSAAPPDEDGIRDGEYRALVAGHDSDSNDSFQCRTTRVDRSVSKIVAQVSQVTRLREVRALAGFTRVTASPISSASPSVAKLSLERLNWLPAVEVLGEGVFVRLHDDVVHSWAAGSFAQARAAELERSIAARDDSEQSHFKPPSPVFLLMHSLAHALIQELSLEAGYPVGSIRERVYSEDGQSAVLLYTASSDAAGSLGGLAALADSDVFAHALTAALSRAAWCTNDPVCSESGPSGADGLNLAACHACLLLPETSCEHRNVFLDRACLVGSLGSAEEGIAALLG